MKTKKINLDELKRDFKLVDDELWRIDKRNGNWKKLELKPNNRGYSQVGWNGKMFLVHRFVYMLFNDCEIPEDLQIDHIDGNPMNNSPSNLRLVSHRENGQNRIEHREGHLVGTTFDSQRQKWAAQIQINGKQKFLGYFFTQEEAHEAYQKELNSLGFVKI